MIYELGLEKHSALSSGSVVDVIFWNSDVSSCRLPAWLILPQSRFYLATSRSSRERENSIDNIINIEAAEEREMADSTQKA
jgi:hypothetical protein